MKTDHLVIYVPERLLPAPDVWDPRLAYELADIAKKGTVCLYDWHFYRWPIEVVEQELRQIEASEVTLWASGYEAYPRIKQLLKTFPDASVKGLPDTLPFLPIERSKWCGLKGRLSNIVTPRWTLFETEGYFQQSGLPLTVETAVWKRRVPTQFLFNPQRGIHYKKASEIINTLKLSFWFDSVTWLDDLTWNWEWTHHLLQQLEKKEIYFPFTCLGNYEKVDSVRLNILREHGCVSVDYGKFPINLLTPHHSNMQRERLQAAIRETYASNMVPRLTFVLGHDFELDDVREAAEFARTWNVLHTPMILKDWSLCRDEADVMKLATEFVNPNDTFSPAEIYGYQRLIELGDHKNVRF
jgi:hypothetical protein